ncbi:MAG: GemA protein [Mesorhizobium amorphae]|nr:MAG: GemA protein [Mesorhizobium amorphae]
MTALAAIHVAKKQLGLDDDTYRDLLERETGHRSAKGLTSAQQENVLAAMRRQGFTPKAPSTRSEQPFKGRFAGILQAYWISAYHLGLVRDRSDSALISFVRRQTGIDHMRWLRDAAEAARVIEALKGWMARGAGVEWPKTGTDDGPARQRAVISAQLRILGEPPIDMEPELDLVAMMQALGRRVRKGRKL